MHLEALHSAEGAMREEPSAISEALQANSREEQSAISEALQPTGLRS